MNYYKKYIPACLIVFICGILFFAYQESWIIINIPQTNIWHNLQKAQAMHIDTQLYVFKNHQWIHESKEIIKTNDTATTVHNLLNSWFSFAKEEHSIQQDITIDSVVLSPSKKIAFISLNHNPFTTHATTYDCFMIIESMLKTIRENNMQLQAIQFLIHHKPWTDHRLNMEIAWPISGYLQN